MLQKQAEMKCSDRPFDKGGDEVPIQLPGFQTFSCSAVSNVFVCPGLLLLLAFDRFFMSFVQRVTHVQNMSTAVYY